MSKRTTSVIDRRSVKDKREEYSIGYFLNGGSERRRSVKERRSPFESREDWVRVNKWTSVSKEGLGIKSPG